MAWVAALICGEKSNHGERIDVVAPINAYSTLYKSVSTGLFKDYGVISNPGTSQAAPQVTGVAAALFSLKPQLKADKPLLLDGNEFAMNVTVSEDAYGVPNPYSGELTFKIGKDSDRYFLETAPILPNGEKLDKVVRFYRNVDKMVKSREDIRNRINSITDNNCPDNFEIIWNPDFLSDNLGHCLIYIPGGLMTQYGNYEVFLVTSYGHVGGTYKLKSDMQNSAFPSVF